MLSTFELANLLSNLESPKFIEELNKRSNLNILNLPDLLCKIKQALATLVSSREYKNWLDCDAEFNGLKCPLPINLEHQQLFQEIGIANEEAMLVKVNLNRGCYLLTDGLWVEKNLRTFPFTDESDDLLSYIERKNLVGWADTLIDLCTGSGNHMIAYPGDLVRIGFDISNRSILYTSINLIINQIHSSTVLYHNLTQGFPTLLKQIVLKKSLFIINTPFALSPAGIGMVRTADGGKDGLELTLTAMSLVKDIFKQSNSICSVRAIVLCYSIGNGADKWYVVEKAREMFGEENISWEILSDRKIWRINGKKNEPNPMLLSEGLPKRADCKFYIEEENKDVVKQKYVDLSQHLSENIVDSKGNKLGYEITHLGYGIIDICMD
jgi:hypothetical protein